MGIYAVLEYAGQGDAICSQYPMLSDSMQWSVIDLGIGVRDTTLFGNFEVCFTGTIKDEYFKNPPRRQTRSQNDFNDRSNQRVETAYLFEVRAQHSIDSERQKNIYSDKRTNEK